MSLPGGKQVVFITGSVWTGSRSAPRKMLVREGFLRPVWFTTTGRLTDAEYRMISDTEFHLARADGGVLAHMSYGGGTLGISKADYDHSMHASKRGVLMVGPPQIAAQVASQIPQTRLFAFKDIGMELSEHLAPAANSGQLQRIDVDVLQAGAWGEVNDFICDTLGLADSEG